MKEEVKKICIKCKIEKELKFFHKKENSKYGVSSECKECKKEYIKEYNKNNKGKINKNRLRNERVHKAAGCCSQCWNVRLPNSNEYCESCFLDKAARATLGNHEYGKDLKEILESQNHRCAYSEEYLILGLNAGIDHIKPVSRFPELVGDINNIQWVTRDINRIKFNFTEQELLYYCEKIVETLKRKREENKISEEIITV